MRRNEPRYIVKTINEGTRRKIGHFVLDTHRRGTGYHREGAYVFGPFDELATAEHFRELAATGSA